MRTLPPLPPLDLPHTDGRDFRLCIRHVTLVVRLALLGTAATPEEVDDADYGGDDLRTAGYGNLIDAMDNWLAEAV